MTTQQPCKRGTGGRPPACEIQERRQHLIAVATQEFLSKGYEATSLEHIARVAGASKTTFYRNFGDKANLFRTVLNHFVEPLWPRMADVEIAGKSPTEVLFAFGNLITADEAMSDDAIALLRLIYREAPRFPEIASVYAEIEQPPLNVVADYLALATRQNLLRIADPRFSAGQFLDLVWGRWSHHLIIGIGSLPSLEERERIVAAAVDVFLNGVTVHPGAR